MVRVCDLCKAAGALVSNAKYAFLDLKNKTAETELNKRTFLGTLFGRQAFRPESFPSSLNCRLWDLVVGQWNSVACPAGFKLVKTGHDLPPFVKLQILGDTPFPQLWFQLSYRYADFKVLLQNFRDGLATAVFAF